MSTTQYRNSLRLALAAAAALAIGSAFAHGAYGPGHGMGCGAGQAPSGAQTCGKGPAPGAGPRHGGVFGEGSLLTPEERDAHRARMHSLASYDECKAYLDDFTKQLQARAKEKGVTAGGPGDAMCDRMKEHGRFK